MAEKAITRFLRWILGGLPHPDLPSLPPDTEPPREHGLRNGYATKSKRRYRGRLAGIELQRVPPFPSVVPWTPHHREGGGALYTDGQGWLNVYERENGVAHAGGIYRTPEHADWVAKPHRKARVFVHWEV